MLPPRIDNTMTQQGIGKSTSVEVEGLSNTKYITLLSLVNLSLSLLSLSNSYKPYLHAKFEVCGCYGY